MPRFNMYDQKQQPKPDPDELALKQDALDMQGDANMMSMLKELYGISQEQQMAPLRMQQMQLANQRTAALTPAELASMQAGTGAQNAQTAYHNLQTQYYPETVKSENELRGAQTRGADAQTAYHNLITQYYPETIRSENAARKSVTELQGAQTAGVKQETAHKAAWEDVNAGATLARTQAETDALGGKTNLSPHDLLQLHLSDKQKYPFEMIEPYLDEKAKAVLKATRQHDIDVAYAQDADTARHEPIYKSRHDELLQKYGPEGLANFQYQYENPENADKRKDRRQNLWGQRHQNQQTLSAMGF